MFWFRFHSMEIFKSQIVGPRDAEFRHCHFRAPSTVLRCRLIQLATPLSVASMNTFDLITSPLLSLFGIYIHKVSGVLLVSCEGKCSFTVRLDEYELQDVIIRTGRLEMFNEGNCIAGEHYIGNEPIDNTRMNNLCGFDLIDEIKLIMPDILYEVSNEFNDIGLIPLIPVYIGHIGKFNGIKELNFADRSYKKVLRKCGGQRLLLFQRIYHSLDIIRSQVQLIDWGIQLRFQDVMMDALRNPINGERFIESIMDSIIDKLSNTSTEVQSTQSQITTAISNSTIKEKLQPDEGKNKERDEEDELFQCLVVYCEDLAENAGAKCNIEDMPKEDIIIKDDLNKGCLNDLTMEGSSTPTNSIEFIPTLKANETNLEPMRDAECYSNGFKNNKTVEAPEGISNSTGDTIGEDLYLGSNKGTDAKDKLEDNHIVGNNHVLQALNISPRRALPIIPRKRLLNQITDIINKKRLPVTPKPQGPESSHLDTSSIGELIVGKETDGFQCMDCGKKALIKSNMEAHISICNGGRGAYQILMQGNRHREKDQENGKEEFIAGEKELNPSLKVPQIIEPAGEGAIGFEATFLQTDNKETSQVVNWIGDTEQHEQLGKADTPEEVKKVKEVKKAEDIEEVNEVEEVEEVEEEVEEAEISQDTFVDASDNFGLVIQQRTGAIVKLGSKPNPMI